jgi:AcrR family transcriptional regulator
MTTSSLRDRKVEMTRETILAALERLVSEEGVHDFSVQQVADAAGISHRTVYRHFPSREALLEGLSERLTGHFRRELGAGDGGMPELAAEDMPKVYETSYRVFEKHREAVGALVTLSIGARVTKGQTERTAWMDRIYGSHTRHLAPEDRDAVVALLRGLGSSTLWYHLRRVSAAKPEPLGRAVRWMVGTLLRELAAGGGPAAREDP